MHYPMLYYTLRWGTYMLFVAFISVTRIRIWILLRCRYPKIFY